ncbi:sugar-binding transcriptional regulator [Pseudooceanicola nanhaiensis]|uniref:sugar-binding transcriptional regulator n=1 Tax=Pseudooceanicola nanhaiensis TaxID=375761 RepID=UPI004059F3E3
MDQQAAPAGVPRAVSTPPPEFNDVITWAAWLYYVDELTQAEVAARLGVSRASIANYLQEARRSGRVTIRVDSATVARTELSKALAQRFSLTAATVVPSLPGRSADQRVGAAGARLLADVLEPGDTVGVAWGRTILAMARAAEASRVPNLTIVQVSGSSASSADFSPELCTTLLANQLGAHCVNLHAPAVLSSRDLRERLLAEPSLQRQFAQIRSATKVLFGVGEIGPKSTFAQSEMLDPAVLIRIQSEGRAKGVIIGRLIDAAGDPVPCPIDDGIVGISLADLKTLPFRMCLAGGPAKREAILATLAGGYATHLVTDSETATALLEED